MSWTIVDVYGMIIALNEVLSGRRPAASDDECHSPLSGRKSAAGDNECHSPRTALLKNVLHSAGSLPMQICGGIRPYLYDGQRISPTKSTKDAAIADEQRLKDAATDGVKLIDTSNYSPPPDVLQRIQHLIRAGWTTKVTDRPVAKGVVTSLRNIVKMLNVPKNEDGDDKNSIDSEIAEITESIAATLLNTNES